MADQSEILQARRTFAATVDGRPRIVRKGATIRADHPLVAGNEGKFKPFEVRFDTPAPKPAPIWTGATDFDADADYFDAGWTKAEILSWAEAHDLEVEVTKEDRKDAIVEAVTAAIDARKADGA